MTKIISIIKKDIRLYFASPSSIVFYIVLPIIFTVVLASTTGGTSGEKIVLNYVDQANSPLSAALLQALGEDESLEPEAIDLAVLKRVILPARVFPCFRLTYGRPVNQSVSYAHYDCLAVVFRSAERVVKECRNGGGEVVHVTARMRESKVLRYRLA